MYVFRKPAQGYRLHSGRRGQLCGMDATGHPRHAPSVCSSAFTRLRARVHCLTLRLEDVDVARRRIPVREGKGGKGRFTMLPEALRDAIAEQMEQVRRLHLRDVQRGGGYVVVPGAFDRKSPRAARDWRCAWVFPAGRQYVDLASGQRRRHHVFDTTIQRAVADAARRAGLVKRVTPHTLRHSFATQLCGAAMTSVRCRSYWVIATCRRR